MTPTTTVYSFGDVVLVPFPFTNQLASKRRLAVVVSSHAYNAAHRDVILMAITSQVLRPVDTVGDVLLTDWSAAGLPKPSLVKPVVATVEQTLILRQLGTLGAADMQALRSALTMLFG